MKTKDKELHRIAITCIIYNDQGKYLVTKRSPNKKVHPNKWTVPGGGLNTNDYTSRAQTHGNAGWYGAVEEALLREVREEVVRDVITSCEEHIKKHGFRKRTFKELDELLGAA